MVIAVLVIVRTAVLVVELSVRAISAPSIVLESIEQTEEEMLVFPIDLIAQEAETGCGRHIVITIKNKILQNLTCFMIISIHRVE